MYLIELNFKEEILAGVSTGKQFVLQPCIRLTMSPKLHAGQGIDGEDAVDFYCKTSAPQFQALRSAPHVYV
jgi:hypothetical protein